MGSVWKYAVRGWQSWIEVSGEDAPDFLQSQFSNDLRVASGGAVAGLWLDHRARIHGASTVLRLEPERFLLTSRDTQSAPLLERLESHVIADEVTFSDQTGSVCGLQLVCDEEAAPFPDALADLDPEDDQFSKDDCVLSFYGRSGFLRTIEVAGTEAAIDDLRRKLDREGVAIIPDPEMEERRIRAGLPRIPQEVGPGETPSETGLNHLCSLRKGCYLGQEVVNRQVRLARANRVLVVVRMRTANTEEAPFPIFAEAAEVGEVRSLVTRQDGIIGLAMLKAKYRSAELVAGTEGNLPVEVLQDG